HACISGTQNGLQATGHLQFAKDRGDVVTHGFRANHQLLCNRQIGVTLCNERQDLSFTLRQSRKPLGGSWRWRPKVLHQAPSDGRTKDGLSGAHHLNSLQCFLALSTLEKIAKRSSTHG